MVQIHSTSCYSDSYNAKDVIQNVGDLSRIKMWWKGEIRNSFWRRGSPEKLDGMEPLSSLCDRILQMEMHELYTLVLK